MACRRLVQLTLLASLVGPAASSWAGAGCEEPLMGPLHDVQEVIDSLRADANSQNRMIAKNGRTYTLAQASWMQQQLNMIDEACRHGREIEATWRVELLQSKLEAGDPFDSTSSAVRRRPNAMLAAHLK